MSPPERPSANDGVTLRPCPACGSSFAASGRRRHCSDACRQAAWRRRHCPPRPKCLSRPRGHAGLSASTSATSAAQGLSGSSTALNAGPS